MRKSSINICQLSIPEPSVTTVLKHWTVPTFTRAQLSHRVLNCFLSNVSFSFSHCCSARQDGTICFMFHSLPFYLCLLPLSAVLLVSYLPCSPAGWSHRSELHDPFHHLGFTSPLKDWPHTKLLFKERKHPLRGSRVNVLIHIHARESPSTGNDPPHPRSAR